MPSGSRSLEDFATIEASCDGVPVYAFGYTYVYGVSPDFIPGLSWQAGSNAPKKLVPKKSWEIRGNLLGSTPAREPKSLHIDDQPLLPVHLIDGDPETCWCSRGLIEADVEPVWIRIDLPAEAEVKAVRIVPSKQGMRGFAPWPECWHTENNSVGQALPRALTVKVSRDDYHWDTVFETTELQAPQAMDPVETAFDPRPVKQVWITGRVFPEVLTFGHCFSIAGVQVLSTSGENLALHSRGAGVTVSSTHLGYGMDRFTQDMLWPIQYDLGFKWARVGYDMSAFQWAYVERQKGKLEVDPRADAAITEAVEHGVRIVMVLDKGNWLHAPEPRTPQRNRELIETYFNHPPKPDPARDARYFEAWLDYVRYMVRHFKDRVRDFEIWNEWNQPPDAELLREHVDTYCRLAGPTAQAIRQEDPEARIILASPGGLTPTHVAFIEGCIKKLNGLVDVVGYHPYYNCDPAKIREYPDLMRSLKQRLQACGFHGQFMATEWSWFASYPRAARDADHFTEMQKAKIAARFMTTNAALGIPSFWNETFQTQMTSRDVSLLRNTFSADPINPTQPQAVYYVLRTLSTALEDVNAASYRVDFRPSHPDIECYALERSTGERVIAVWLAGEATDDAAREHVADILVADVLVADVLVADAAGAAAYGIDSLNGTRHELRMSPDGTSLPGVTIRDWPFIIVIGHNDRPAGR